MRFEIIVIIFSLVEALTHFGNANPIRGDPSLGFDSPFYVKMLLYLAGDYPEPPPQPFRMRPIIPAAAIPLYKIIGINNAFGLVNTVLWVATALVMYSLAFSLTGDARMGLVSSLAFSSTVPILVYGAAISTDMVGYLVLVSSIFIAVSRRPSIRTGAVLGPLLGVGILARELVVIAIPTILAIRLSKKESKTETIKELVVLTLIAPIPPLAWQLIIPDPGYTAYFAENLRNAFTMERLLKSLTNIILTYHIGWIFIAIGFFTRHPYRNLLISCSIPIVLFLIVDYFIGVLTSRFVVLTFPTFLIWLAVGIDKASNIVNEKLGLLQKEQVLLIILALYIAASNIGTAEYNIALPSLSDEPIKKLFPTQ